MCFSATASFTASAALIPAGGYCISSVVKRRRLRYLPLAAIPLVFGVQQFSEGMVWRGLAAGSEGLRTTHRFSQIFLFFALAFWPFWMPFVSYMAERRRRLRLVMAAHLAMGAALGAVLFAPVALDPGGWMRTTVFCSSIRYDYLASLSPEALPTVLTQVGYLLVAGIPILLSSDEVVSRFGALMVVSALIAHLFYSYAFASVWCFFAALLSGYLCWELGDISKVRLPRPVFSWPRRFST